jgi:hypothetical protein
LDPLQNKEGGYRSENEGGEKKVSEGVGISSYVYQKRKKGKTRDQATVVYFKRNIIM